MVDWSGDNETSTNGIRVGIDLSYSGSGASREVVFELWVWTKQASAGSSASYSRSWDFASSSGSFSYNHPTTNPSSPWSTNNQTRIGRWTASASLNYGSQRRISASGSVSGLSGNMPPGSTSHSHSILLPARPYLAAQAPTGVSAVRQSAGSIRISWTRRSSTARPVDVVRLERQTNTTSGSWTLIGSYSVADAEVNTSGVSAGNRYRYRVRAEGPGGNSSWVYTSWTGYSYLGPNAPTGVSASRSSDTRHVVSWSANPTSARPIDSFRVQRRVFAGGWSNWSTRATVSASARSWADTGTRDNRVYQWRVVAVGGGGTATSSSTGSYWTTPWSPNSPSAQATASGIRVRWGSGVRYGSFQWEIQRQEGTGAWVHAAYVNGTTAQYGNDVTWTHQNPDVTVTHQYRIRSRTTSGPLLTSDWQTTNVVQLASPPNAPTITGPTRVQDAAKDVALTYRHNPSDGSEQQSRLIRWRYPGGQWAELLRNYTSSTTYILGDTLNQPGVVELQVRTWGAHPDPSPWSPTFQIVMANRPTVAINEPTQGALVDTSSVLVTWGYADEDDGEQTGWRLTLLRDGVEEQVLTGSGATGQRVVSGLADDAEYTIRLEVRAPTGLWSDPDEVTFPVSYLEPDPATISVGWDVDLGAATVAIEHAWEDGAEPAFHQLWRAIGDGPWLLIADEIPLDAGAVTDPIPVIGDGTVNYYRVRTVSVLPSTADSETVALTVPSTGRGGTGGWVYLNAGPGMAEVCRVRANATRGDREGLAKDTRRYRGRRSPVLRTGTAHSLSWDVSARIAPDYDGASTRGELVALQGLDGPVMYRDPLGARWAGAMGEVSSSWRSIMGEVEWSMVEVDWTEGLATDSAGSGGGGDDDDGGDPQ